MRAPISSSAKRLVFILVALWMNVMTSAAQNEPTALPQSGEEASDTIDYINFRRQAMVDVITDTTLAGNFHTADAIERDWPYIMDLGYSGSPVYSPHYFIPADAGWNPGFHAFDHYRKRFDDLLFVKNGMPITKLTYVQTPQVNQSIFDGYFSRRFEDMSFALNHQRYNFTGDYLNQRSFNTIFHTGLTIDKERWLGYLLFASEVFDQSNNGGISSAEFYGNPVYENRSAFPVRFRNAASRDDTKKGKAGMMLKTIRFGKYGVNTGIELDLEQRMISMNSARPDSSGYFPDYTFRRQEGFNSFSKHRSFSPGVVLEFSDSTHSSLQLRSTTGLNINSLQDISRQRNWQEFVQKGDLGFRSEYIDADAHLDLRIFNNNVYFDLKGNLSTRWRGFGVSGYVGLQRTATPLIFYNQNFSGESIWNQDPPAAFHQILGGALHYEAKNLQIKVNLEQIFQQNVSFFNEKGLPSVISDQTIISFTPELGLHLGIFHFKNHVSFFPSENILPYYPTLSGRHTLFIEDKWFKNRMHINLGFTAFWKNSHPAAYYLPYTQSFVPTNQRIEAEYRLSPFFAFRVKTFKFFVRMENLNLFWQQNQAFYDVYHYPQPDPMLRMGIEWLFRN